MRVPKKYRKWVCLSAKAVCVGVETPDWPHTAGATGSRPATLRSQESMLRMLWKVEPSKLAMQLDRLPVVSPCCALLVGVHTKVMTFPIMP